MTDSRPDVTTGDDTGVGPDREEHRTPRWVKVFGLIAVAVVGLFIVLLLAGGGGHGPGRHLPGGGVDTVPSSVTEHSPPPGGHGP